MTEHPLPSFPLTVALAADYQSAINHQLDSLDVTDCASTEKAQQIAQELVNLPSTSSSLQSLINVLGADFQQSAIHQVVDLKQTINNVLREAAKEKGITKDLADLKLTVDYLDPRFADFDYGWLSKLMGFFPGLGTPLSRYMTKFANARSTISSILHTLSLNKDQLLQSNNTLETNSPSLWQMVGSLKAWLEYAHLLNQSINKDQQTLWEEKFAPTVQQRIAHLQHHLGGYQQAILISHLVVHLNYGLASGIDRILTVIDTIITTAGNLASTIAGFEDKKMNADQVLAIKPLGDALLISFQELKHTLEEMESFRTESLSQIHENLKVLEEMIQQSQSMIPSHL